MPFRKASKTTISPKQHDSASCTKCSAEMEFKPGTDNLICQYCGWEEQIEINTSVIKELDYLLKLEELEHKKDQMEALKIECDSCSAKTLLPRGQTAASCAFCGSDLIINCLLYTSPSPRDQRGSRMPSSA